MNPKKETTLTQPKQVNTLEEPQPEDQSPFTLELFTPITLNAKISDLSQEHYNFFKFNNSRDYDPTIHLSSEDPEEALVDAITVFYNGLSLLFLQNLVKMKKMKKDDISSKYSEFVQNGYSYLHRMLTEVDDKFALGLLSKLLYDDLESYMSVYLFTSVAYTRRIMLFFKNLLVKNFKGENLKTKSLKEMLELILADTKREKQLVYSFNMIAEYLNLRMKIYSQKGSTIEVEETQLDDDQNLDWAKLAQPPQYLLIIKPISTKCQSFELLFGKLGFRSTMAHHQDSSTTLGISEIDARMSMKEHKNSIQSENTKCTKEKKLNQQMAMSTVKNTSRAKKDYIFLNENILASSKSPKKSQNEEKSLNIQTEQLELEARTPKVSKLRNFVKNTEKIDFEYNKLRSNPKTPRTPKTPKIAPRTLSSHFTKHSKLVESINKFKRKRSKSKSSRSKDKSRFSKKNITFEDLKQLEKNIDIFSLKSQKERSKSINKLKKDFGKMQLNNRYSKKKDIKVASLRKQSESEIKVFLDKHRLSTNNKFGKFCPKEFYKKSRLNRILNDIKQKKIRSKNSKKANKKFLDLKKTESKMGKIKVPKLELNDTLKYKANFETPNETEESLQLEWDSFEVKESNKESSNSTEKTEESPNEFEEQPKKHKETKLFVRERPNLLAIHSKIVNKVHQTDHIRRRLSRAQKNPESNSILFRKQSKLFRFSNEQKQLPNFFHQPYFSSPISGNPFIPKEKKKTELAIDKFHFFKFDSCCKFDDGQ
jgi:uncharacterized DUF497 family protein